MDTTDMASDAADDGVPVEVNGVIALEQPSQVDGTFPANTITPTADFAYPWNGALVQFRSGDSVPVDPNLIAALVVANAPFTQP